MQIATLKVRNETGLVPAGRYFEHLTRQLKHTDQQQQPRRGQQERACEAIYRRGARDMQASH